MPRNHILIISSRASTGHLLKEKVLLPADYQVTHAKTLVQAGQTLTASNPDLVLLEARLDKSDPLSVLHDLTSQYPALPVIFLPEEGAGPPEALAALKMGAVDCLIPPYTATDLLQAVQTGLARRKTLLGWVQSQHLLQAQALQTRIDELEKIARVGQAVTANLNLDQVLTNVLTVAVALTGAEEGNILLLDEATGELYMRAALNFKDEFVRTFRLPIQDTLAGQVLHTGKPILLDKATPEKIKTHYLVHTLIYIPLQVHGRAIGVLGVDNRSPARLPFNHHHINLLEAIGHFAAIAIENARLYTHTEIERSKLETILRHIADGVIVVGEDRKLVMMNRSARLAFGLDEQTALEGKPVDEFIRHEELLDALRTSQKTGAQRVELTLETGRSYLAEIVPMPDVGLTATMQDITHFKELDQIKSDFVRTVSHDLRSPLTAILGYVELIERVGEINKQQREFIRRVQISVHNITNLVNDLLDLGRIEAGFDKQKELVPIPVIIRYAADSLQANIAKKEQTLSLDMPSTLPPVYGNPIRLRQMLQNLIENASKYTPTKGAITVRARAEGGQMIIQVEDNGIGIPPSDQPYIFEKLYRASNVASETPGSGLGLAIVKSIVESHGGRYWFDSTLGQGTIFTVVFPLASAM